VSSSGLIYAVIVGAWAAYLVPMWLRRQDELNESRPTERFSTAIRLLAGRSAMERRAARALDDTQTGDDETNQPEHPEHPEHRGVPSGRPDAASGDVATPGDANGTGADSPRGADAAPGRREALRGDFAPHSAAHSAVHSTPHSAAREPVAAGREHGEPREPRPSRRDDSRAADPRGVESRPADTRPAESRAVDPGAAGSRAADPRADASRHSVERRARLLARRRRMVTLLFAAFALGAIVAAVAGIAFIWVPAVPAALLTLYIGHLRRLERQRYEVKLDRARAAQAAERLRDRERARAHRTAPADPGPEHPGSYDAIHATQAARAGDSGRPHLRLAVEPGDHADAATSTSASAASAVAEATEHEEWVDGMRERAAAGPDSWEPVPVPLPTYVTAPVAPRVSRGLDLGAPGTWDSGRTSAEPAARTTPLFDQYAEPSAAPPLDDYATRPRAANE